MGGGRKPGGGVPEEREVLARTCGVPAHGFVRDLLELFCGEVRGVGDGAQAGDEGRLDVPDSLPVDAVEEGMLLDLLYGETLVWRRDQSGKDA